MNDASPDEVAGRSPRLALVLCGAAVAGHVGWLLMLSPDPWVLGFGRLGEGNPVFAVGAALFGLEVVVLATLARQCWSAWRRALPVRGSALVVACALLVLAGTAIPASPYALPSHLALTAAILGAAWLSTTGIAAHAGPLGLDGAIDRLLDHPRLECWVAAASALTAAGISWTVFKGIPHIPDEVVYLLQAKYMAAGSLYVEDIPAGALDAISTVTADGRWFGIFPLGWPALLSAGVVLGLPWLVNPVLTAVAVISGHGLVRRLYERRTANLAALLLGTSPWFLFLGASLMAHTASIVAGLIALRGGVELARNRRSLGWALTGGLALGLLVLIRPFEAVLLGLVVGGTVVGALGLRALASGPLLYAGASVALGGVTLLYNRALTGSALVDPITLYFDRVHYPGSNRMGFGADIGNLGWGNDALTGHTPLEAAINTNWNVFLMQIELFGWAFGSLLVLLLWSTHVKGRVWRPEPILPAVVGAVILGYAFYWYSAADFGPRYWSQTIVPLAALTAHALLTLPTGVWLRRVAIIATALGAPVVVATRGAIKYNDYRGMTRDLEALAQQAGFSRDLVLIRGDVFSDYSPGLILNPPSFEGDGTLYFRYIAGEELDTLLRRFPGRTVRIVEGASITGGAPRLVP